MSDERTAKSNHHETLLQSQAMKLWDAADEEGRYWLMERQRCKASAYHHALTRVMGALTLEEAIRRAATALSDEDAT